MFVPATHFVVFTFTATTWTCRIDSAASLEDDHTYCKRRAYMVDLTTRSRQSPSMHSASKDGVAKEGFLRANLHFAIAWHQNERKTHQREEKEHYMKQVRCFLLRSPVTLKRRNS